MNDDALTIGLWALTVVFAVGVVWLFKWVDRRRILAEFVARPCPKCGRIYGPDILNTLGRVRYHWILKPGNTVATLGVPHSTFLVVCPGCKTEAEFNEKGRLFVHPQVGVLSFIRNVQAGATGQIASLAQSNTDHANRGC